MKGKKTQLLSFRQLVKENREMFEAGHFTGLLAAFELYFQEDYRRRKIPDWIMLGVLDELRKVAKSPDKRKSGKRGPGANSENRRFLDMKHFYRWQLLSELREQNLSGAKLWNKLHTQLDLVNDWVDQPAIYRSYNIVSKALNEKSGRGRFAFIHFMDKEMLIANIQFQNQKYAETKKNMYDDDGKKSHKKIAGHPQSKISKDIKVIDDFEI